MKKKTLEFLETHQSETPSKWREEAEWRRDNWSWLRHSQKIAAKVLLKMKQENLTQKVLAERMNCTQQYVSKILKGKENMSLDTLSRLENALGISLILDERVSTPNMITDYAPTPSYEFEPMMASEPLLPPKEE
ncbi:MAG: helix-turn-helix transcriptional regulator [Prevotella sp.]|nr:helix-turn-helix transcriptional regulator [Prevotella sp.]